MASPEKPKRKPDGPRYTAAIGFGTTWATAMLLFMLLGSWADRKAGGGDTWALTGVCLGLAFGAYELWKLVRAGNRADEEKRSKDQRPPPAP